ncbi:ferritin [Nocardia veterana]|uniref:Ferritin n=1 Tax=Nocardia veterana TaxID=132249 RepID=A0A7X6RHF0_9NOCA|nr:ferritin-like domain-containing protein [Nocardia veterana]NKY85538.1 ferritin [Nocardia veterana]
MSGTGPFLELLRTQIRHEFTTSQQYLAVAVYFDAQRLPQLARICYLGADDKRAHALRMVQYLLDRDAAVAVTGTDEVRSEFESPSAAVEFLLSRERESTDRITALTRTARDAGDYLGEQFVRWFLDDQLTEVARLTTLATVCARSAGNLFDIEEFVAREIPATRKPDASAPKPAGIARR